MTHLLRAEIVMNVGTDIMNVERLLTHNEDVSQVIDVVSGIDAANH